jgi:hypothetical protein
VNLKKDYIRQESPLSKLFNNTLNIVKMIFKTLHNFTNIFRMNIITNPLLDSLCTQNLRENDNENTQQYRHQ